MVNLLQSTLQLLQLITLVERTAKAVTCLSLEPQAGLTGDVDADDPEVDAVDERPWSVP